MNFKKAKYIHLLTACLFILVFAGCNTKTVDLSIKAYDANDSLTAQTDSKTVKGIALADLNLQRQYQPGDYIAVEGTEYLEVQFDEKIPACLIYAPSGSFKYPIPFDQERSINPPESFTGSNHKISIKACSKKELSQYRNLALNPFDIRGQTEFYPHATSNSEFGGESCFSAKTAIDGYKANKSHGGWPFQSWGPDKIKNIWFKIEFGREVEIDKLVILNRADYDHDSYWKQATIEFSDGTSEVIEIARSKKPQEIKIKKHLTSSVKFTNLIKHEDKWIAWTEVQVWGTEKAR